MNIRKNKEKIRNLSIAIGIALLNIYTPAIAKSHYPDKNVNLVIAYGAGGPSDIVGRVVGKELSDLWGNTVIVENKPGASGHIAGSHVARAKPDGHTLLLIDAGSLTSATHLMPSLNYDPLEDLVGVAVMAHSPHVFAVRKDLPVSSFPELLEHSKKNPGKLSVGTLFGLPQHLGVVKIAQENSLDWTYVSYKGSGNMLTDIMGGHVDLALTSYAGASAHTASGQIRIIAVASPQRFSIAPELPTVAETMPDFAAGSWQILLAPKDTPAEIVEAIYQSVKSVVSAPEFQHKLTAQGFEVADKNPTELNKWLKEEFNMWGEVAKSSNIKN